MQPDLVIFVMDGSIGQAAFDQAKAFKDSVPHRLQRSGFESTEREVDAVTFNAVNNVVLSEAVVVSGSRRG